MINYSICILGLGSQIYAIVKYLLIGHIFVEISQHKLLYLSFEIQDKIVEKLVSFNFFILYSICTSKIHVGDQNYGVKYLITVMRKFCGH